MDIQSVLKHYMLGTKNFKLVIPPIFKVYVEKKKKETKMLFVSPNRKYFVLKKLKICVLKHANISVWIVEKGCVGNEVKNW